MAITASGYYGLTLVKQLNTTSAGSMESTDVSVMLMLDSYSHNYDTHDFRADLTATEVAAGNGYTAGGKALAATPGFTIGAPATGQVKYDSDDPAFASSTITNAMAAVIFDSSGSDSTDELYMLSDFGTAVSTANGTLTVLIATNGRFFVHYTA